jgi:methylmalonyl-CoA carboxyltransferase 5S subunit
VLTKEFADLMLGYYGETIGERDPEVIKLAIEHAKKEPITVRPADLLPAEWDGLRDAALALDGCDGTDEDVLTYAMFPQVAPNFFSTRSQGPKNLSKQPEAAPSAPVAAGGRQPVTTPVSYDISLNGRTHKVSVQPA